MIRFEVTERMWSALELAKGRAPTPTNIDLVANQTDAPAARWAFSQWELRRVGTAKFSRADEMLFLREALEQATHEEVARFHASLFPEGALVADLTCGICGDVMALAARGPTIGFELDRERATYARHNAGLVSTYARIEQADCLEADLTFSFAIADPARRVSGRRTLALEQFAPNPTRLASRLNKLKLGLMKMSPMLSDKTLAEMSSSCTFVSFGRECREALLAFGDRAEPIWQAHHAESGTWLERTTEPLHAERPARFLYEVDPAVVRAHATGSIAQGRLEQLGDFPGFTTSDEIITSPVLRRFEVLHVDAYDPKRLKGVLRGLGAHIATAKQRGAGLDLDKLGKTWPNFGPHPVTLAFWRQTRRIIVAILDGPIKES